MNTIQDQIATAEAANKSGNYIEAEQICRKLLAQELQPEEKAIALEHLSASLWRRGFVQEALPYAQESLAIFEELDNKSGVAIALGSIGIVYNALSDYPHALEYYHQALIINEELDNKRGVASNLGNIGIVYLNLSEYPRALEYLHKALAIDEELGNKRGVASNLGNIGIVYEELSEYPRALEYLHQALTLDEELGNKTHVAENLNNLAIVYANLSEYPRALEYFQQALTIDEELGNKTGVAASLGNIGVVCNTLSDYPRALDYFQQALKLHEDINNKSGVAANLSYLGSLYIKVDFADYNPVKAEEYLLRALAISQELGTKRHYYEVYKSLADLYKHQKRWQEHAEYLQIYYDLRDEVQSEEVKKQADKFVFERQIAVMEKEREVTDMLLHKFLPSPIVNDVKAKQGKLLVQKFESISVLFADLVGFTKLSLSIKPEIMIEMLNFIFTKFDTVIKEAGGHRIRTMGDGYFAICGAPDRIEQHQYKLAKAALAMQEDIILPQHIKQALPEGTVLHIRIGLHCGEAVCGMVGGLEKWQYDVYGDTVNTASRMESNGEAGKIHVSEEFKNALVSTPLNEQGIVCIERGEMEIKGKGMMKTYFLS